MAQRDLVDSDPRVAQGIEDCRELRRSRSRSDVHPSTDPVDHRLAAGQSFE